MKVLIIIPVYNEEKNIEVVLDELFKVCPEYDILVVDDGSKDDSYKICVKKGINTIKLPVNLGIGGARQAGFKYALYNNYDVVIQLDGDGQHDPKYISKMIEQIENGINICIGSRFIDHEGFQSTFMRRTGIVFLYSLIKLITGQKVTDPTSGFRACDKKAIEFFAKEYPQDYPEPETIVSANRKGLKICEVPVTMNERMSGKSSINKKASLYFMVKVTLAILINAISNK